jgi:ABC-2 type transport system ATP-binding protein
MLTTLLPPTSGSAKVMGFDVVRQASAVRARIGYVPQLLSADGTLTGYENLMAFAALYDIPHRERRQRVLNALAFVGLSEFSDKVVKTYSGGMIRRLEIAQSTVHRPPVLFLDEPTIGLDPIARKAVWGHVGRLRQESGTTIMMTTHYMEEADELCDRVAIMHLGRVVAVGSPTDLKLSVGGDGASLEDVFSYYTGNTLDSGGTYRDTSRARRTAYRLG